MVSIFMRHGEAANNLDLTHRVVGQHADLTPTGQLQCRYKARILTTIAGMGEITLINSSEYPRCQQTAEIVAEEFSKTFSKEVEVQTDSRLNEIFKGEWQGMAVKDVIELEAAIPPEEAPYFRPPGGENWVDCARRFADFVKEAHHNRQTELSLSVSHNHPILTGCGLLFGLPVEKWYQKAIHNAGVKVITNTKGLWRPSTIPAQSSGITNLA